MTIVPEVLPTEDGSLTLRHPVLGDTYHSTRGAVGEAEHIFIRAGFETIARERINILEVGFGSGLNALLTMKKALETGKRVEYHAIERYPVDLKVIEQLNYILPEDQLYSDFIRMHTAPWNSMTEINDRFRVRKYENSLVGMEFDTIFDGIYFDAFAPDTQPEMWSESVFRKLYAYTAPGGILVTYSAKGVVKRALRAAGYEVERRKGALGKRHMLRAVRNE